MLRRHLIPDLFDRLLRRVHGRKALDRVDRAAAAAEISRFSSTFGTWNQTPAEYVAAGNDHVHVDPRSLILDYRWVQCASCGETFYSPNPTITTKEADDGR